MWAGRVAAKRRASTTGLAVWHASDQPQVYAAKSKYRELDGAFFGMSSCHVFRTAFVSQWLSIGTLKVLSDWCFSELVDLHIEIFQVVSKVCTSSLCPLQTLLQLFRFCTPFIEIFCLSFWKFVVRTLSLEKSISATSVLQVVPADLSANLSNPTSTGDTEASLLFILQTRWLCRLCIKIAFLRVQMSTAWARHQWDVPWNFHPLVVQALLSAWGRLSLEFSVPSSDPIY